MPNTTHESKRKKQNQRDDPRLISFDLTPHCSSSVCLLSLLLPATAVVVIVEPEQRQHHLEEEEGEEDVPDVALEEEVVGVARARPQPQVGHGRHQHRGDAQPRGAEQQLEAQAVEGGAAAAAVAAVGVEEEEEGGHGGGGVGGLRPRAEDVRDGHRHEQELCGEMGVGGYGEWMVVMAGNPPVSLYVRTIRSRRSGAAGASLLPLPLPLLLLLPASRMLSGARYRKGWAASTRRK